MAALHCLVWNAESSTRSVCQGGQRTAAFGLFFFSLKNGEKCASVATLTGAVTRNSLGAVFRGVFCFLFVFLVSFVFVYFLLLFTALLKLGEGVRSVMAHLSRNFPVHRLSTRFPRGGARARMLGEQRAKQKKKKGVFLATEIGECAYISRNMPRQHVVKTCLFLERVWFLFFRSVFFLLFNFPP